MDLPALVTSIRVQWGQMPYGRLDATQVSIAAAIWLEIPFARWAASAAGVGGEDEPPAVVAETVRGWNVAWSFLAPEDWSEARVTQVVDALTSRPPQVSKTFARLAAEAWGDGSGPIAQEWQDRLPEAVLENLRERLWIGAIARPLQAVLTDETPITTSDEVERLLGVDWKMESRAVRCTVLRRCVWEAAPPSLWPALRQLIVRLVPSDAWNVLAVRTLLRAQRSAPARALVADILYLEGAGGAMESDRVTQAFCAQEMVGSATAAALPRLVELVLEGWHVLPDAAWIPAVTQIVRHGAVPEQVRENIEAWWAARENEAPLVDEGFVAACLSSQDRALAQWAMLTLVPVMVPRSSAPPYLAPVVDIRPKSRHP